MFICLFLLHLITGICKSVLQSLVKKREKVVIDSLIDVGSQKAGDLDKECVHSLYT